ncbi:uncharacterized protein N7503_012172 [Penicillium pulvis]|uniref:uncharacterized protein n=1 Tax=Penicillium pulvis TaxID=1562058 RepID=UPI002548B382|nr:uncharacterized protein N7503_012172 [Penicillium pulvis]KAJ5786960.1 hypothetical protein N7503_012172 [Penicillium pulvis]
MKYQLFPSLTAIILGLVATVSASPLMKRDGSCPSGYTLSVYYETVTITDVSTPTSTSVMTASASITNIPIETPTTTYHDVVSTSYAQASSSVVSIPEATIVQSQEHVADAVALTSDAPQKPATSTPTTVAPVESSTTSSSSTTSTTISTTVSTTSASSSSSSSSSSSETAGTATYYGGNLSGGTCSFSDYTLPSSLFGTALSIDQWDDAANCGACVSVKGPNGKTIKAMIVDECPSCATNHFDLFEDAFGEIADISAGVVDIDWEFTSCDLDGALKLRNKSGSSQYWFSMQVVNANEPVSALEASTDGGSTWIATTRTSYNYFEYTSGFGTDTVDVRVTGKSGNYVVVKDVSCSTTSDITADSNL